MCVHIHTGNLSLVMRPTPRYRESGLVCVHIHTGNLSLVMHLEPCGPTPRHSNDTTQIGLNMISPLPILYGLYCNKEGSGGNNILRNRVGDKGGKWGAQSKGVFAQNIIDSCPKSLQ